MSIKRRHFLQLTGAAAAAAVLPLRAQDSLTLWGPPVSPTVLLAIAAQMGEAKNIRPFQVKSWQNPDQLRAGLVSGDISISIVPSYVAANLRNQGQAVRLHNIMTKGLMSLMSKNGSLSEPSQVKGQKIVMPFKGDMPDLVLQILAKRSGIELADLVTYTATPPEAVGLFLQQDYPYALLPEPLASAAILRGKQAGIAVERGIVLHDWWNKSFGTQSGIPQAGLMVSETFAAENAAFLAALDQDLLKAIDWLTANPKSAAEIAAGYMPAPVPALQQALPNSGLMAVRSSDMREEILNFFQELYHLNPKILGGKAADPALLA